MSDKEIVAYFQNHKGNACGRFQQAQLKSYTTAIDSPSRKRNFSWLGAGLMSVSLFSFLPIGTIKAEQTSLAYAQQNATADEEKDLAKGNPTDFLVQGTISDEEGALPGVYILLKGTTIGTATDIDGKFSFPKRLKVGDILVINYIGYETKEYVVTADIEQNLNVSITLDYDDLILMGAVAVKGPYSSKRSLWQKIKAWFSWKK